MLSNTEVSAAQLSDPALKNSGLREFETALNLFQHDFWGRFGRAVEYDFQAIEQPTFLVNAAGMTVPNPEHYLKEQTLKFQFSELFPASSALADAVKNACTLLRSSPQGRGAEVECTSNERRRWILEGGGFWKRLFSGATLNFDASERSPLQQGVVITSPSFYNHNQWTYGVEFDPSQLFLSGTNWSKAYDAIRDSKSAGVAGATAIAEPYDRCEPAERDRLKEREDCIRDLSSPRLFSRDDNPFGYHHRRTTEFLAMIVPTVSFKTVSQFDFIRNGGVLVPASYLESSQKQFVLKWDLKKVIAPPTSRTALMPNQQQQGQKLCVIVSGNFRSYISVSSNFKIASCEAFAVSSGARYLLGCVTDAGISVEADRPPGAPPDTNSEQCWKSEQGSKPRATD